LILDGCEAGDGPGAVPDSSQRLRPARVDIESVKPRGVAALRRPREPADVRGAGDVEADVAAKVETRRNGLISVPAFPGRWIQSLSGLAPMS